MKSYCALALACVLTLAVAGIAAAEDWGKGRCGIVPMEAPTIDSGVYAAKAEISTALGKATYPAVLRKGGDARVLAKDGVRYRNGYDVLLGAAHWCVVEGNAAPAGAVVFGDDGGPMHLVKAMVGETVCYGSQKGDAAPVIYRGDDPVQVDSYMMLCN